MMLFWFFFALCNEPAECTHYEKLNTCKKILFRFHLKKIPLCQKSGFTGRPCNDAVVYSIKSFCQEKIRAVMLTVS